MKRLLTQWLFENSLIDFLMAFQSVDLYIFPEFAIPGTICSQRLLGGNPC